MKKEGGRLATNLRALCILEAVAAAGTGLTATEINKRVGLPKPSIHRLCRTLEAEGYIEREPGSARLRPTQRVSRMASGLFSACHDDIAQHQILERVSRQVGETVNFAMPTPTGMTYRDRVETVWAFRIQLPIGTNVPFHCTASGKAYLSSLDRRRRRSLLGSLALEPHTDNTITDPARLDAVLDEIRHQGHAVDDEEFIDDMVAVAVPVTDPDGRFVAFRKGFRNKSFTGLGRSPGCPGCRASLD